MVLVNVGKAFTVTVDVDAVDEQPFAVYVTVYGVVAVGETVTLEPVPPVDHAYVPPAGVPVAEIVAADPAQTVWLVLVMVGITFTVMIFA